MPGVLEELRDHGIESRGEATILCDPLPKLPAIEAANEAHSEPLRIGVTITQRLPKGANAYSTP